MGELGEKERKLIELRYFEDKTQTQTAKLFGYESGTGQSFGKENYWLDEETFCMSQS